MKLIRIPICAVMFALAFAANGQAESARRFTQSFYNWYTHVAPGDIAGPGWDEAIKSKAVTFNPKLLRALREDLAASEKNKDEIVGLDFDPFLNSQDPETHYSVGKVVRKGATYILSVHGVRSGRISAKPDVFAKLEKCKNGWRFTNFLYPDGTDLLTILTGCKRTRIHHR